MPLWLFFKKTRTRTPPDEANADSQTWYILRHTFTSSLLHHFFFSRAGVFLGKTQRRDLHWSKTVDVRDILINTECDMDDSWCVSVSPGNYLRHDKLLSYSPLALKCYFVSWPRSVWNKLHNSSSYTCISLSRVNTNFSRNFKIENCLRGFISSLFRPFMVHMGKVSFLCFLLSSCLPWNYIIRQVLVFLWFFTSSPLFQNLLSPQKTYDAVGDEKFSMWLRW